MNSKSVEENVSKDVPELSVREIAKELERKNSPSVDSTTVDKQEAAIKNVSKVTVELTARELTWLRLVMDKSDTVEYMLNPGNKISQQADSVMNFLVGNAGGVSFKVNGKNMGVLGRSSEIVTNLKITSKGIVSKRIKTITREQVIDPLITD